MFEEVLKIFKEVVEIKTNKGNKMKEKDGVSAIQNNKCGSSPRKTHNCEGK